LGEKGGGGWYFSRPDLLSTKKLVGYNCGEKLIFGGKGGLKVNSNTKFNLAELELVFWE